MKTDINSLQSSIPMEIDPKVYVAGTTEKMLQQSQPLAQLVNQICNAEIPELTRPEMERQSVEVIKNFMRKVIAAQSYEKMFAGGKRFESLNQSMMQTEGKANFKALDHLDSLSKHYLQEIKEKTPNLNREERNLLRQIVDSKMTLRHQSNSSLAKNGQLTIFSNDKLDNQNVASALHTYEGDKLALSNHDFVFFGVEFSEDKNAMPLNRTHMGVDFGANAYLINDDYPHGYLTLTDHFDNRMPHPDGIEHKEFARQFQKGVAFRLVTGNQGRIDVPIYNTHDMRMGLGLHVVNFLRETRDENLKNFAFKQDLKPQELDRLINFIFQPEFHLPRMVSTRDYTEVKLRDITLEEAIDASNFECLNELVQTKESACEAMVHAIGKRKEDVILSLFDRFTFTQEDGALMYKMDDLNYILSNSGARASTLKLFIDKGLVDVYRPLERGRKGDTILDNAIEYKNKDIITLLRNLGLRVASDDLEEAVLSSNFERLNTLATSGEKVIEALTMAVSHQKIDVISSLLDKNQLTQDKLGLFFFTLEKRDLLNVLSGKDADINILRLFLDRNLIDIHFQTEYYYPVEGNSVSNKPGFFVIQKMLGNATKHGRNDIVTLLKNYDASKKKI